MKPFSIALTTALFLSLPASVALAQTPTSGNDTPAQPAPAASPAPAPAASPSPAPAPAATPAPPASPSASAPPSDTTEKKTASKKRKSSGKMTRRQEIDRSIDTGTVPSRYRSQVPKEYQRYIPFDKQ